MGIRKEEKKCGFLVVLKKIQVKEGGAQLAEMRREKKGRMIDIIVPFLLKMKYNFSRRRTI